MRCGRSISYRSNNFSLLQNAQTSSGADPASCLGTRGSFPEGKMQGIESKHSPTLSAEAKCESRAVYPHPLTPLWRVKVEFFLYLYLCTIFRCSGKLKRTGLLLLLLDDSEGSGMILCKWFCYSVVR
jgi:hypothetical protein